MDGELRGILCEEWQEAHKLTEYEGFTQEVERVVNTERVQYCGKQHILSDETSEAGTFQIRLEQSISEISLQKFQEHEAGEEDVQDSECARRIEPVLVVINAITNDIDEDNVEEGVCTCDWAHKELDYVPTVELENILVINQSLNLQDGPDFPNTTEQEIETKQYEKLILEMLVTCIFVKEHRCSKDDEVVNEGPNVKLILDAGHE